MIYPIIYPIIYFLFQINPVGTFEAVWTSQNTNSKAQASLWAPSLDVTVLHSNKTRVCLGHYANKGLNAPTGTSRLGASRYFMVELTDDSKSRISGNHSLFLSSHFSSALYLSNFLLDFPSLDISPMVTFDSHMQQPSSNLTQFDYLILFIGNQKTSRAVLAAVFPHPLRFKQSWHLARGDRFLYAWKAIPPEGFLALGMISSCSGTQYFFLYDSVVIFYVLHMLFVLCLLLCLKWST